MGENPSQIKDPDLPVINVSWDEATAFCAKLSAADELYDYRLPTEAEWEYAARARTTTYFYWGDSDASVADYAWYFMNSENPEPVGQKRPNAWGLYDMSGNVWEWCEDRYGKDYYADTPTDDPQGPTNGMARVVRGGSWRYDRGGGRSADRGSHMPDYRFNFLGFRVVAVPKAYGESPSDAIDRTTVASSNETSDRPTYETLEQLGAALIESLRDDDIDKFMSTCISVEELDAIVDSSVGSDEEKEQMKEHFADVRESFRRGREKILDQVAKRGGPWESVKLRAIKANEHTAPDSPTPTLRYFNQMTLMIVWEDEDLNAMEICTNEGMFWGDSWRFSGDVRDVNSLAQPVTGFNPEMGGTATLPLKPPAR